MSIYDKEEATMTKTIMLWQQLKLYDNINVEGMTKTNSYDKNDNNDNKKTTMTISKVLPPIWQLKLYYDNNIINMIKFYHCCMAAR